MTNKKEHGGEGKDFLKNNHIVCLCPDCATPSVEEEITATTSIPSQDSSSFTRDMVGEIHSQPAEWEIEFDALFVMSGKIIDEDSSYERWRRVPDPKTIRSFIREKLAQARLEGEIGVVDFLLDHGQFVEDSGAIGGKSFIITASFIDELKSKFKQ